MSFGSRLLTTLARLPRAETHKVSVERDLRVTMDDGTVLLADRWWPTEQTATSVPIILVRSPYGRANIGVVWEAFAARGYQVVAQSCRGTFGSGGDFTPFRNEAADGLATLGWLEKQPWFSGSVATFGPSYVGLTQWAVAAHTPPWVKAMALGVTASQFRDSVTYPGKSFALETTLSWAQQTLLQERGLWQTLRHRKADTARLAKAYGTWPLADADVAATGHTVGFFQDWLHHDAAGDTWWDDIDFSASAAHVPPATMVGGWYDIFLPYQLADYQRIVDAGGTPRLTIGPWKHASLGGGVATMRDALDWFDVTLRGRKPAGAPVRVFVMGAKRWVDMAAWPPPATTERWYLQAGARLSPTPPPASAPDFYTYDPHDPTPSDGGTSLNGANAGPHDQATRESRRDVLVYTSTPRQHELTIVGPVTTELHLKSTGQHLDVFVRLCDVDPKGVSTNLCDGILRLGPGDLDGPVRVSMWPTANTFKVGHSIRLQVSSGAHPTYARNPGTGEPLATAASGVTTTQEVHHDPDHASAVELPVVAAADLHTRSRP